MSIALVIRTATAAAGKRLQVSIIRILRGTAMTPVEKIIQNALFEMARMLLAELMKRAGEKPA